MRCAATRRCRRGRTIGRPSFRVSSNPGIDRASHGPRARRGGRLERLGGAPRSSTASYRLQPAAVPRSDGGVPGQPGRSCRSLSSSSSPNSSSTRSPWPTASGISARRCCGRSSEPRSPWPLSTASGIAELAGVAAAGTAATLAAHLVKSTTRLTSTAATRGFAQFAVSLAEDVVALVLATLAFFVPRLRRDPPSRPRHPPRDASPGGLARGPGALLPAPASAPGSPPGGARRPLIGRLAVLPRRQQSRRRRAAHAATVRGGPRRARCASSAIASGGRGRAPSSSSTDRRPEEPRISEICRFGIPAPSRRTIGSSPRSRGAALRPTSWS